MEDRAQTAEIGFTQREGRKALVDWVHGYVKDWEDYRDQTYKTLWERIRMKWNCDDGKSDSDNVRSRHVSPALQQAVEDGAAELEEVILGKEGWFDVTDSRTGQQHANWGAIRYNMMAEMERANLRESLLECFFLSSLYGTAIGKLHAKESYRHAYNRDEKYQIEQSDALIPLVCLEPVLPWHFVIDTSINKHGKQGIMEAMGMAHRLPQPKHKIRALQNDELEGVPATYYDVPLDATNETPESAKSHPEKDKYWTGENYGDGVSMKRENVLLTEYHGLVPRALMEAAKDDSDVVPEEIDTRDMVECIVTYVNDNYLLAVRENKNLKQARQFVAAPWDIVPGRFWGRGVGEKAYPAQRVLDIFLRGQIDAMRYHVYPIMVINSLRVPARQKVTFGPGSQLRVQGLPQEAMAPAEMPPPGPGVFQMDQLLSQHITQATGITPDAGRGERTLGGTSALRGAYMKRTNRTLRLLSKNFLSPLVETYYYMQAQLNPELFSPVDVSFEVRTATGMMAREQENSTLGEILQFTPPQSPMFWTLIKLIIDNTSSKDKPEVAAALEATIKMMQQPDPRKELEMQRMVHDDEEVQSRTRLKNVQTQKLMTDTLKTQGEVGNDHATFGPSKGNR